MATTEANKYIEKLNNINSIKHCSQQDPNDIVAGIPIKAAQQLVPPPVSTLGAISNLSFFSKLIQFFRKFGSYF